MGKCFQKRNGFIVCDREYLRIPREVAFVESYSLCLFFGKDSARDTWSERIYRLRGNDSIALRATIDTAVWWAVQRKLLNQLGKKVLVVGAIPSAATILKPEDSTFLFGQALSKQFGFSWGPGFLAARPHKAMHYSGRMGREERLKILNYIPVGTIKGYETLVIVDDLITTSATLESISRALAMKLLPIEQPRIYGISLARKENFGFHSDSILKNDHLDKAVDEYWEARNGSYKIGTR